MPTRESGGGHSWQEVAPPNLPAMTPGGTIEPPGLPKPGNGGFAHGSQLPSGAQTAPHAPAWPHPHDGYPQAGTPQKHPEAPFECPGAGK